MSPHTARTAPSESERGTKGSRTSERILDAAESLFAERGYERSTLRAIAERAGIQQPGIYNHFRGKRALYTAVLDRALTPMLESMQDAIAAPDPADAYLALPALMTDHLAAHPHMAALFHQALRNDEESVEGSLVQDWLDRLFGQGMETLDAVDGSVLDREERAIRMLAMFNLTTGYFLSQRAFSSLVGEDANLRSRENLERQKRLLTRLSRSIRNR